MAIITLLTDFGTQDGYVGEMKGVLATLAPTASILDISHELAPHDIDAARLTLARYWKRFPAGTVHVVVVDPGVGSSRAALAVRSDSRFVVGPDNGALSPALLTPDARVVALSVPDAASSTFHGRDVFAPAAARLAMGEPIDALGVHAPAPIVRRTPEPHRVDGVIEGEVIAIDRFGSALTNLIGRLGDRVRVKDLKLDVRRTFSDLARGDAGAIIGSSGLIEIVVREGRAVDVLQLERGTPVSLG